MIDDVFIPFIVFNIYHIVHLDFALLKKKIYYPFFLLINLQGIYGRPILAKRLFLGLPKVNIYHIVHLDFGLLECLKLGFEIGHRVARSAPNITDHYTTDPPILLNLEKGQAPGSRDIENPNKI